MSERSALRHHFEQTFTNSHIEESDLSSISGTMKIMFVTAEGSTVNLHNSENIKIIQENYDAEASCSTNSPAKDSGVFPKINADTVHISAYNESPLQSINNTTERKNSVYNDSSLHSSQLQSKQWTHSDVKNPSGKRKLFNKEICDNAKLNLETKIQNNMALNKDYKAELMRAKIRINALEQENIEIKAELDTCINERTELMCAFEEQRNHSEELEERIKFLEKDPSQIEELHGKLLENAKMEIEQLRLHLQDRDKKLMKLEALINKKEREQRTETNATLKALHDEAQRYKDMEGSFNN